MISLNLIINLFIFISQIICIDIKLSLLNKNYNISNNSFPVIMTFKDDSEKNNDINIKNKIDFIFIIDYVLDGSRAEHAKDIMIPIVEHFLEDYDKITFFSFSENKDRGGSHIKSFISPYIDRISLNIEATFFDWDKINKRPTISEKYRKIRENQNSTIIKSIFYFTENHSKDYIRIVKDINNFLNSSNDFSLYLISDEAVYPTNFSIFSDSGNISYFPFNDNSGTDRNFYTKYVNDTINDIRNIKYKDNYITIESKFRINKFYGKHYLNIISESKENENFIYSFSKYNFISKKEYIYAFDVVLDENIKYGDRILNAKNNYKYLNGSPDESSSSLKFYNAINYFNAKKKEFCKILLMEAIELFLINKSEYNYQKLIEEINPINLFCKEDFSKNIDSKVFKKNKKEVLVYLNTVLNNLLKNN